MIRSLPALAAVLALAVLTACGGSGGDEDSGTNEVAPTFTVSTVQDVAIDHTFAAAGTYTLTLTGDYAPNNGAADTLDAWFSFSGQGSIASGDAEPQIPVTGPSTHFRRQISVTLDGAGPWSLRILTNMASGSGTMSNLKLNTSVR